MSRSYLDRQRSWPISRVRMLAILVKHLILGPVGISDVQNSKSMAEKNISDMVDDVLLSLQWWSVSPSDIAMFPSANWLALAELFNERYCVI